MALDIQPDFLLHGNRPPGGGGTVEENQAEGVQKDLSLPSRGFPPLGSFDLFEKRQRLRKSGSPSARYFRRVRSDVRRRHELFLSEIDENRLIDDPEILVG